MGISNLKPTIVNNLNFLKINSLIISEPEEFNYKESVKIEKKKLILMWKHNEEEKDAKLIQNCFEKHFLLKYVEKPALYEIIRQLSYYKISKGIEIFMQGMPPGYFFILSQGICEIIIDGEIKRIITNGSFFGELSLIYGCNKEYTIRAQTECYIWAMKKKNFMKIAEHIINVNFESNKRICTNHSIFKTMRQIH